ncbi:MAG: energy-coupling factor transporter transmembrane protein EcfT [Lactobacillus sp.]|uniref:energy-coupling factor transporter transmembrane component T family protein n=1 Tax=Lactobacillus sp. TaxID=1591 RepID=UPI0023C04EEC|nr:energy-coupling factor transporter transmembrane component T [Lactobacillus sp.]MDE7049387.1 energy-coupling factor transporter transmembrane protein EcfT [Lactobacillus sp.]
MNPGLKLFLILIISLEISLIPNLTANIIIIGICLIYLLIKKINLKKLLLLFLVPLFAAAVVFITIYYFTPQHSLYHACILPTRIYAYVFLGSIFTETTSFLSLARSLEQNFKLPSKFAYGTLAAFNVIPKIQAEVNRIRLVGDMRHYHLSFYSPILYFKAILAAISWSNSLAEGMISHGYREDKARSVIVAIPLTKKDWLIFSSLLVLLQPILFLVK